MLTWPCPTCLQSNCVCSVVKFCLTLCDRMNCSPPDSMAFHRQEYWHELLFPGKGNSNYLVAIYSCYFLFLFLTQEIKPASPALAGRIFTTEPSEKPKLSLRIIYFFIHYLFSVYSFTNITWVCLLHSCSKSQY